MSVAEAKKTLAGLQAKLAERQAAEVATNEAARRVSFSAWTTGGAEREKLDLLNRDRVKAALEIDSLRVAVSEAEARVEAAGKAADMASEREKAKVCLARLPAFRARGEKLNRLAEELKAESEALSDDARFFIQNGVMLNQRIVDLAADRALRSISDPRSIPPAERHRIDDLIETWAASVDAFSNERLNSTKRLVA